MAEKRSFTSFRMTGETIQDDSWVRMTVETIQDDNLGSGGQQEGFWRIRGGAGG